MRMDEKKEVITGGQRTRPSKKETFFFLGWSTIKYQPQRSPTARLSVFSFLSLHKSSMKENVERAWIQVEVVHFLFFSKWKIRVQKQPRVFLSSTLEANLETHILVVTISWKKDAQLPVVAKNPKKKWRETTKSRSEKIKMAKQNKNSCGKYTKTHTGHTHKVLLDGMSLSLSHTHTHADSRTQRIFSTSWSIVEWRGEKKKKKKRVLKNPRSAGPGTQLIERERRAGQTLWCVFWSYDGNWTTRRLSQD